MKKFFALISLFILSSAAYAQSPNVSYSMPAAEVGFNWRSTDIDNSTSGKQEIGFQVGASTVFNLATSFGIKTGLFYTERPFKAEIGTDTIKGKMTYFDVPILFMFKFEEYAGVYVGPTLAMKLGDEVNSPYKLNDIKGMVIPITFGVQFKFLPKVGANVFFETIPGEVAKGIKNSRAVGANLMFTFD